MAERDTPPPGDSPRPSSSEVPGSASGRNSSDENGHADSPDETLSPTSVIYFKEALSSSNVRFGGTVAAAGGSLSPTPLRRFDFHIERIGSKRRSDAVDA
ncbi:hypothetical protein F2P81_014375 [Scophthalmus maximus]|uniref:Uncharacterized protein n=1 Tax=Scophthalmus maximus TaxID=52904 RepID=A0A6A4SNN5_SCOMX|nr:hypothetical protein F2P81_014375 [Scophthalmus maximus]